MPSASQFANTSPFGQWESVAGGAITVANRPLKLAKQSLTWTWNAGSHLRVKGLVLTPATQPAAGMHGWVYSAQPQAGRLLFQAGSAAEIAAGKPGYQFQFGLNFSGWRHLLIQFIPDAALSATHGPIEQLVMVPPAGVADGVITCDSFEFTANESPNRSADLQIPEHPPGLGVYCQHWPLHYLTQTPRLPIPDAVSEEQRRDFKLIAQRHRDWLLGDQRTPSTSLLASAISQRTTYIKRGWEEFRALHLQVSDDGLISGPGLTVGRGEATFHHVFYNVLLPLAFDVRLNRNAEATAAALLIFDYVHQQGWAEGSANGSLWLNCLMFAPYCHALTLLRDELRDTGRLERAERAAMWYLNFGKTFSDFDAEYIETNADELRSTVYNILVVLIGMEDSPRKVQYLHGWLGWLANAMKTSPRFTGVFKPDGLGFHHQGVYANAYSVEAYEFTALIVYLLHGTSFAVDATSVAQLANSLKTLSIITHTYEAPLATQGRMPDSCQVLALSAYAYLALAHEPHGGEISSLFMRLWNPTCPQVNSTLCVALNGYDFGFLCFQSPGRLQLLQELADRGLQPAKSARGFWSKPWGALAIHRRDEWMVSVKGYSQYVWDFEMHPKSWAMHEENVYARFWSHGTLQPLTTGSPVTAIDSGWNLQNGWDWSRWPGSTTRHLALDELYDPKSSWACRFFSSSTFVGGVTCTDGNGMFALKLHEHFYDPSFRAYKTYFFFDHEIICLGSNIESRDVEHHTTTTLFQSWMSESQMPIDIDGIAVNTFPYAMEGVAGKSLRLRDPYGNGFILPDAAGVHLRRGTQESRDAWNQGSTSGSFSTCWIDHGTAPKEMGYEYVQLIQVAPMVLAAYQPAYVVAQKDHRAHILFHQTHHTTAYALFETDWEINHGHLYCTDTPVMLMVTDRPGDEIVTLAISDPDLRLPKRRNMGFLDSMSNAATARDSRIRIELRGRWQCQKHDQLILSENTHHDTTALELICRHGTTITLTLRRMGSA